MLICFAPVLTRGMKINYVNHILRKSEIGTIKADPYNQPLNRERSKMPSSAHLGLDYLGSLSQGIQGDPGFWAVCPSGLCSAPQHSVSQPSAQ